MIAGRRSNLPIGLPGEIKIALAQEGADLMPAVAEETAHDGFLLRSLCG